MIAFFSISNFPITCIVANCNTTTTKKSITAMENYMSQQTGCKIFRVCARTQLNDQELVLQIFENAKQSTGIFHVWGDVPLAKINTLRTVAAEFPTLKVVFSCTEQPVLSRIDRDVHCLFLKVGI